MIKKAFLFASLLLSVFWFSGCTTPTQSQNMVSENLSLGKTHDKTVYVQVGDGNYTEKGAMAQISNQSFYEALVNSIEQNQAFSTVVKTDRGDLTLFAEVVSTEQPMIGVSMTVTLTVFWKLMDSNTKRSLFERTITSTYRAEFGEAVIGAARLRKATEGAARENIKQALEAISQLDL